MKKILLVFLLTIGNLTIINSNISAQICTACFTATPDPFSPSSINLDATCSNASPSANYEWVVDGTSIITFPFPYFSYPFPSAGVYNIDLIIYDGACVDTASQTITIANTCSANFVSYPTSGGAYSFYTTGLYSPTANFSWDYGDGNTGNTPYGYNVYAAPGTYTVCCIINDTAGGGCADTSCQTLTVGTASACNAFYYYNIDPLFGSLSADASFSVYNPSDYNFSWYLNGTLVQQNQNTNYSTILGPAGNYDLTLVLTDSNFVACDSMSQTIYWSGGAIFNPGCYPCYNVSYNATYDSVYLDASCSSIPSGGSLLWNVNGNVFPDPGNVFLQGFATTGIQNITLYAIDSNGVTCDSLYQNIYTYGAPCISCLTVSQVAGSTSDYVFSGSCSLAGASYTWLVNNNYVLSTNNPQFTYSFSLSGTYDICLQTMDSLGTYCNQSCTTIVVSTATATQFTLSGRIYQSDLVFNYSPAGLNDAKVYLIKLMTGGILEAVDSTNTDANGYYTFANKPIDDYRVKVALNPGAANYATNIPSYFTSALMWYDAQVITLFGNTYNKDIFMNYGVNTGGSGFISGNVFLGSNKPTRSGPVDVTLILIDIATNKPIAYAKTNASGDYSFNNVPDGSYKVVGELLNRASVPDNIVINAAQNTFTGKNFVYNDNVIKPTSSSVGINEQIKISYLSIAPNPATNTFRITNKGDLSAVKIYDVAGRIIWQRNIKLSESSSVDCSSWHQGMYFIEEQQGKNKQTQKLIIRH